MRTQRVYPYPYGFNPKESSDERDYSGTLGLAGEAAGWKWDLSTIYGKDEVNVYTLDSINSSLYQAQVTSAYAAGAAIPLAFQQDFRDGVLEASQWTTGLDISKELQTAIPVTVAFGLEYRKDTYEIVAGEPSSYYGSPGAQSFPGYQPWAAGHHSRDNKAIYANVIVKPLGTLDHRRGRPPRGLQRFRYHHHRQVHHALRQSPMTSRCAALTARVSARRRWRRSSTAPATCHRPPPSCSCRRTRPAPSPSSATDSSRRSRRASAPVSCSRPMGSSPRSTVSRSS